MEKIRINKYIASLGIDSRRAVDRMVEEGRIKVNGKLAESGMKIDPENDILELDEAVINRTEEEKVYYLLNKPKEFLCSSKDDRGRRLAIDLIDDNKRIYNVGRLDYETEGLLVMTNDGDIFNHLTHPKKEIYKTYVAIVYGKISEKKLQELRDGVKLEDGITAPAIVKFLNINNGNSTIEISIREGKNRQIRRMFIEIGHRVAELMRISIGDLKVENIESGDYREFTEEELLYVKSL